MNLKQRQTIDNPPKFGEYAALNRVLCARGVENTAQLDYGLAGLLPPAGLTNVHTAAVLLAEAITSNATIVIVGDFDADGATSCALAMRCLRAFGLDNVSYLVPNRFEYGYGLSPEIVGVAALRQPDIIITVDNGISSVDGVYAAQQLGISVLITDHHLPGDELPTADVIVNPNLPNDQFASKNLAGVGVIFYVMLAVRAELRSQNWFASAGISEPNMGLFLDLVALGTVADVVPLDYNNRILVQQGLQRIRSGMASPGINALLLAGKRNAQRATASDLGFAAGPRLNAAGRLDDMSLGIECLLAESEAQAQQIASQLDELNRERREVEHGMQGEAVRIINDMQFDKNQHPSIYILHDESWHQGVVGLVASRIKERVNRPVLALAPGDNGEWKGSARSVEGVHIRDLLARVDALYPELMSKFGGHAMAAGLSIEGAKLASFEKVLSHVADDFTQGQNWEQVIWTDGELSATEFTESLAEQLRTLTPWGQGFPEPVFEGEFAVISARTVGEYHAKLKLNPLFEKNASAGGEVVRGDAVIDAIYFSYHDAHAELPSGHVHIAYQLDINEWQGKTQLQLLVRNLKHGA